MEKLRVGDLVDVVAPSAKCHPDVLVKFRNFLEGWGLKSHIPVDLFGENLLYAHSDEMRFSHLEKAFLNPESKVIWTLLGGFGATRLIPMLNQMKAPQQEKILIGFSDITALHIFLQEKWGWTTIHGPSAYQTCLNKVSKESVDLLKQILFAQISTLTYDNLTPLNKAATENRSLIAPVVGGNMHLIQASLGTAWKISTDNKILFIEECHERGYRIDRLLMHFEQAGLYEKVSAIIFGDMIDQSEPDGRCFGEALLKAFAADCEVPVLQIKNIGHGKINNPLLLGSPTKLITGDQCAIMQALS